MRRGRDFFHEQTRRQCDDVGSRVNPIPLSEDYYMNWLGLIGDIAIALALFLGLARVGHALRADNRFTMNDGRGY
jgi:hypothetical protein